MTDLFLGKCRYCGQDVFYQDGQTYVHCTACGETLAVAGFLNEQIRISRIELLTPALYATPAVHVASARFAPTDRSMPPRRITHSSPSPSMATIGV